MLTMIPPTLASLATGVGSRWGIFLGDEPDSVPAVGSSDGTSRNNKRLDGISCTLKISTDCFKNELLSE